MRMVFCCCLFHAICLNLLRCQISCHIQLSFSMRVDWNWLTNRFFFILVVSICFYVFFLYICAPVDRSPVEPFIVVIYTHTQPNIIFTICAGFLWIICNKTKAKQQQHRMYVHCYLVSNTARIHLSFHLIQKYSIHQPHSLCFSLLHMRFDRIGAFFYSFVSSVFSNSIVRSHSMGFESFFFFFIHILRKSDKIVVLLLCMYFIPFFSLHVCIEDSKKKNNWKMQPFSLRLRNT